MTCKARPGSPIEESKQTAAATVADMLETHGMLRSDTTALFERLREANILLQEVLSGAHENMSSLERTMVTRVSEFVAAMNDLNSKSAATTSAVEQHLGHFNTVTGKALQELGELATQFTTHGRSLADAVRASGQEQPSLRGIGRQPACQHRDAGLDARCAHRGFRAAAAALLRPARRIARCGDAAGTGNRQRHRRDEQRKRATPSSSSSSWCARPRRKSANAPARP